MTTVIRLVMLGSLVLAGLAGLPGQAAAQEWAPFGTSQNGDPITMDRRSIIKQDGNAAFTMRVNFSTPAEVNGKAANSLEARIEIDCAKATYRRAEEKFLDAASKPVSTAKPGDWTPIPGNSFGAALRNFCK